MRISDWSSDVCSSDLRALAAEFFPGMPSRVSGIGLPGIEKKLIELHKTAYGSDNPALSVGGLYRYRRGGETHAFEGNLIHLLQSAVANDAYSPYLRSSQALLHLPPIPPHALMDFKPPPT